jgi:hypothetical protein
MAKKEKGAAKKAPKHLSNTKAPVVSANDATGFAPAPGEAFRRMSDFNR